MENELSNGTRTVVDVLREVAARQPDAVAVRWRGGELRYAEFLRRVDGVAGMLQARGVGAGTFVGVYLSRSIEMLVALLGTLAAGACYVPMDPDMPAARLRHIVADSGTHIVLSDRPELADAAAGIAVVPPSAWPADGTVAVTPPGLAYMIYTSGSTGRPKGVPVEHAALSQYVAWCLRTLNFSGGGVPLFGSIAYDHVITSLFPPLSAGEHLRLLDNIEGGSSLAQALLGKHEDRIPRYSYLKITPSHVRMLNVGERAALGRATEMIIFGGERLQRELVDDVRRDAADLAVLNHYGPTEATVGCCAYSVPPGALGEDVPIGYPMPGVAVSVRDVETGAEVPEGISGELYIGGDRLSSGYWNRPDATAEAFVWLPGARGPERWYRSGDVVYRRADGALQFVGRRDDQVKILGHRVEPGEIEAALRAHDGVAAAAVFPLRQGWATELVAGVESRSTLGEAELRAYLRARLPAPMIPSRFAFFERLPATTNGKTDRAEIARALERRSACAAGSVEELTLAKWRDVLRDAALGSDDDFFEIGGDSIAAVEICLWAMSHFAIELEPTVVFEFPTVRVLAAHIEGVRGGAREAVAAD